MSSTKTSIVNVVTYVCFAVVFFMAGQLAWSIGMIFEAVSRP